MKFIYLNKSYSVSSLINLKTNESWLIDVQLFLFNWLDNSEKIKVSTSGSTGTPKSINLLKSNMRQSALITNTYFDLNSNKTALLCLPAQYIAGKMMLVRALEANMNLVLVEPASQSLNELNPWIDFVAMTPFQVEGELKVNPNSFDSIETVIIGGGAVSNNLSNNLQGLSCQFFQTYGMTETITHIALQPINGSDKTDHFEVLDGFGINQDSRGCLTISADHIYKKHVITNDLVEILGPKSFRWLGRLDNVINTGGVKVFPEVIESKIHSIMNLPFFITGQKDEQFGNIVTLCIESKDKKALDQVELLKQIKSRLSKFEIPRSILIFDCFIYTETGKIQRTATLESQ